MTRSIIVSERVTLDFYFGSSAFGTQIMQSFMFAHKHILSCKMSQLGTGGHGLQLMTLDFYALEVLTRRGNKESVTSAATTKIV